MKKNILNKKVSEDTIARVKSLGLDSKCEWGTMEVTEMLRHCNLANRQILEGAIGYKKTSLKQRAIGFLCLYILPKFPRNIKGPAAIETRNKIAADQFEQEKKLFIETMKKFAERKDPIQLTHPAFGNLTTKQWGRSTWMHMDHHLRQFGV